MPKIYGQTTGTIIPESDFRTMQSENGGWNATQSFRVLKGDLDLVAIRNKFPAGATLVSLDEDCDDYFAYLKLANIESVETLEGGWTRIGVRFTGFAGAGSPNDPPLETTLPTYSLRGVLIEEPLSKHPKWAALTSSEKFALGLLVNGDAVSSPDFTGVGSYGEDGTWSAWEDDSGEIVLADDAAEFAELIAQGNTTYKHASYEYTVRWEDNVGISATQLNDLGKIDSPSGSPPEPSGTRNWMLVGVNQEQQGTGNLRFSNELVYLLSESGGHNSFLYSDE